MPVRSSAIAQENVRMLEFQAPIAHSPAARHANPARKGTSVSTSATHPTRATKIDHASQKPSSPVIASGASRRLNVSPRVSTRKDHNANPSSATTNVRAKSGIVSSPKP